MILVTHILVALASLAFTTYLFFAPSRTKLNVSYGLVSATLISGTYLVVSRGTHILEACVMGLFYVLAISLAIISVRQELAADKAKNRTKPF